MGLNKRMTVMVATLVGALALCAAQAETPPSQAPRIELEGTGDEWKTAVPQTYCADYGRWHIGSAGFAAYIAAHPPTVLHVTVDTVFSSLLGAIEYGSPWREPQLTPGELRAREREVRAFVDAMHAAGVKTLMPYQNSVYFFGDHEKRTGLFEFYDHWDDYADFGIGPRPIGDPAEWADTERRPANPYEYHEYFIYEACINHPGWRAMLRMAATWAARVGYDAVFSDINGHRCYRPSCQAAFRKYLCAKYAPADLERLFGFRSPQEIRMGKEGEGLLWVETQRCRGHSFAELFAELTEVGQQYVPGFFVLPNSSSYSDIESTYQRRSSGQNIGMWARSVPIVMYEKMEQPGRVGRTAVTDNFLQYKYAFANRVRTGMLLYSSQEPHSIALSNAEAAALGGGSFIQDHYRHPEVRMAYRRFFESNHDLLAGYCSYAQVAVAFFYDELYWDNRQHLEQVFCLKDYLCDHHVLWDFVVEKTFNRQQLAKYAVVIVPDLQHLSDAQVELLREYAQEGGGVVLIAEAGRFTEEGTRRDALPLEDVWSGKAEDGVRCARCGKGWIIHATRVEDVIERPAFELFQLTEEESSYTWTILEKAAEAEATRKPQGRDRLLGLCEEMARRPLSVAGDGVLFTLRLAAYWRRDAEGRRITVHLLNYDVTIHGHRRSGPPVAAENVSLRMPLPVGWQAKEVHLRGPQAPADAAVPFEIKDGRLLITVPRVEIYEIVEVLAE